MEAAYLSLVLTSTCNARCPFCFTEKPLQATPDDNRLLRQALPRALRFARYHRIDTVLITGTGEPTALPDLLFRTIGDVQAAGIPLVELQTNGALLAQQPEYLDELAAGGVATVAITVASTDAARSAQTMEIGLDYLALVGAIAARGLLCRVSLNLRAQDQETLEKGFAAYVDRLAAQGARQLTVRALEPPPCAAASPEMGRRAEWIARNQLSLAGIHALEEQIQSEGRRLRRLAHGPWTYDYRGVSVCVVTPRTVRPPEGDVRAFVLMPDGRLYHDWEARGSVVL